MAGFQRGENTGGLVLSPFPGRIPADPVSPSLSQGGKAACTYPRARAIEQTSGRTLTSLARTARCSRAKLTLPVPLRGRRFISLRASARASRRPCDLSRCVAARLHDYLGPFPDRLIPVMRNSAPRELLRHVAADFSADTCSGMQIGNSGSEKRPA